MLMRRLLAVFLLCGLLCSTACADVYTDLAPGTVSIVHAPGVNFRREPALSGELLYTLPEGATLTLLSADASGWVYAAYAPAPGAAPEYGYVRSGAILNGDYLIEGPLRVVNPGPDQLQNLHTQPDGAAPSLGLYHTGVLAADLQQRENGFVKVRIGGLTGWMDKQYVTAWNSVDVSEIPVTSVYSQPGFDVKLYREPAEDSGVLASVANGTEAAVLGEHGDSWRHVMIGGVTGYVQAEMLAGLGSQADGAGERLLWFGEAQGHRLHRDPYCGDRPVSMQEPFAHTRYFDSLQAMNDSCLWTVCTRCGGGGLAADAVQLPDSFHRLWNASLAEKARMLPGVWSLPSAQAVPEDQAYAIAKEYVSRVPAFVPYLDKVDGEWLCTASLLHYDACAAGEDAVRETYKVLITSVLREPVCIVYVDALTGEVYGAKDMTAFSE